VLGFDWVQADEEASRLEHALSEAVAERLSSQLGRPATCPHGNPIPGAAGPLPAQRRLVDLGSGDPATILRISEAAEHEAPELLRFLSRHRMVVGATVVRTELSHGSGTLTVEVAGESVPMSLEVASKIWVS
jgi:DtxR family transcriptional regulator, Mn-dependent transcriptional regulator